MELNFTKHFLNTLGNENESNDEDYVPEISLEVKPQKRIKKLNTKKIIQSLNENSKNLLERKINIYKKDKNKSLEELYKEAKITANKILNKKKINNVSQKTYSFADKFYVLINNSFLKEIEKKPLNENYHEKTKKEILDEKELLLQKNMAVQDLIKSLSESKAKTLTSVLKSKYDWKSYISKEKIEEKLQYLRKDDKTFKKLALFNNN